MKEKGITTYTQLEYFTLNVNYLKKNQTERSSFCLSNKKFKILISQ